jgi:hypothetical protein
MLLVAGGFAWSQPRRKIIINEDCSGPGGSNLQTLALLIQSPEVEVLGITVVSGNQWRDAGDCNESRYDSGGFGQETIRRNVCESDVRADAWRCSLRLFFR